MNDPDPAVTRYPNPISPSTLSPEIKKAKIEENIRSILQTLGLDLTDPSLTDTPARIAKMYVDEVFSGLDPKNFPSITFHPVDLPQELIVVKQISFVSFCEHHFVPMLGYAHVAYIPEKKIVGLSKINRIVRYFAKRPQLQERLTAQIADSLSILLGTKNVAIITHARHFCMLARGVEDRETEVETSLFEGRFKEEDALRREFLTRVAS